MLELSGKAPLWTGGTRKWWAREARILSLPHPHDLCCQLFSRFQALVDVDNFDENPWSSLLAIGEPLDDDEAQEPMKSWNLNIGLNLALGQAVAYFVQWTIIGIVIGLIYKPSLHHNREYICCCFASEALIVVFSPKKFGRPGPSCSMMRPTRA